VSRRATQKTTLVLLSGLLSNAKRRRWITENPAEFAEEVSVTSSGEFNVLEPEHGAGGQPRSRERTRRAFHGRRLHRTALPRELRALRRPSLDFQNRIVHQ
jgi:hypothetical protein